MLTLYHRTGFAWRSDSVILFSFPDAVSLVPACLAWFGVGFVLPILIILRDKFGEQRFEPRRWFDRDKELGDVYSVMDLSKRPRLAVS